MMKHRSKTILHIMALLLAALAVGSCSDELVEGNQSSDEVQPDGMAFDIRVEELAERLVAMGQQTKATALGDPDKDGSAVTPFEGGEGLSVHRLSLPFVGIHPGTVPAGSVAEAETKASTADIVGSDYKAFHDTMAVWGYTDKNRVLFNNTLLTKVNGWRSSLRWPYDTKRNEYVTSDDMLNPTTMRFYALSPSMEDMEITLKNTPGNAVMPQFEYTVPDNPAAQRDLLYGESGDIIIASIDRDTNLGNDNKTVPLTFLHILTAVRFAQGNMPAGLTIRSITLSKIMNKGTYDAATPGWSGQTGEEMYTIEPNSASGAFGTHQYVDNNEVLFLMPQTLASGAKLEVVVRDGGGIDHTLKADISGTWAAGATVTYLVTVGEMADDYYFLVSETSARGGSASYSGSYTQHEYSDNAINNSTGFYVHSYFNYKNYSTNPATDTASPVAAKWKIAGFSTTEGGDYSITGTGVPFVWLSSITGLEGSTAVMQEAVSTNVTYQLTAQRQLNHQTILKTNNLGNETYVDLSLKTPTGNGQPDSHLMTTANCYVVNAAGTYMFPTAYGNSWQNGTETVNSNNNPASVCVDHLGHAIEYGNVLKQVNKDFSWSDWENVTSTEALTSAEEAAGGVSRMKRTKYSYGESASDVSASLLWQDVSGMIKDVEFRTTPNANTLGYIGFTVDGNAIQPGNAVIALKADIETVEEKEVRNSSNERVGSVTTTITPGAEEILWTWHIWVTDEVLPNNDTHTDDKLYPSYNTVNNSRIAALEDYTTPDTKYNILPVNLGWVPNVMDWTVYEQRDIWVKLVQYRTDGTTPTGKEAYVKLREEAVPQCVSGTSTLYQWGRPTAFPMLQNPKTTLRNVYDISGATVTSDFTVKNAESAKSMVLNPMNMLRSGTTGSWWNAATDPAFWSSAKTLYDPCPPGYQMPSVGIFKVFSLTGASSVQASDLNMWPSTASGTMYYVANQGGYMYAKKHTSTPGASERYHNLVYMPTHGLWSGAKSNGHSMSDISAGSDNMWNDPSQGYYWTYSMSGRKAVILRLQPDMGSGRIIFEETKDTWDALPIRPMAAP